VIVDFRLPNADLRVCDAFIKGVSAQPSRKSEIKNRKSEMGF